MTALLLAAVLATSAAPYGPGSNFGPAFNFGILAFSTEGGPKPTAVLVPSLRGGARLALLPRSSNDYSLNVAAALQVGLEGLRRRDAVALYAFGVTARVGAGAVTIGGPYAPFVELYALSTLAIRRVNGEQALVPRFGVGLQLDLYTAVPEYVKPSLSFWWVDRYVIGFFLFTAFNVELVVTPPNVVNDATVTEVRLGFGF